MERENKEKNDEDQFLLHPCSSFIFPVPSIPLLIAFKFLFQFYIVVLPSTFCFHRLSWYLGRKERELEDYQTPQKELDVIAIMSHRMKHAQD